jgi:hypothetical protein
MVTKGSSQRTSYSRQMPLPPRKVPAPSLGRVREKVGRQEEGEEGEGRTRERRAKRRGGEGRERGEKKRVGSTVGRERGGKSTFPC